MTELGYTASEQPRIEPAMGSVKLYNRHLFVCTGTDRWPARIEEGGGYLEALSSVIKLNRAETPLRVKLTACDEASQGAAHDILVFPDQIRYLGVQEEDFPVLIQDHLIGNRVTDRIPHQALTGQHIFICVHGERDSRCGLCGPPLVDGFRAALDTHGLVDRVSVRRTSHVGGHKFAANVLIYPSGDWYGYVTTEDIRRIVEQHILEGQIVRDLWRGRMGLTPEDQLRFVGR